MASLASSVNFGTVNKFSFCKFHNSVCLDRSVSFSFRSGKRWKHVGVCKYSVIEQGTSLSLDSTYRGSKDNDADKFLVAKSGPKVDFIWDEAKQCGGLDNVGISDEEMEKGMVIEKLGEVLEKAEELENTKKVIAPVNKPSVNETVGQTSVNYVGKSKRKSKTLKSVWRRGNAVGVVQKVVTEPQKQECRTDGGGADESKVDQVNLQTKPSVAQPPLMKKPVALKDVNAAAKPTVGDGTDLDVKENKRKPILIDKFASKKSVVDPLIAQAVLPPPKAGRKAATRKDKDEFRKKDRHMVDGNARKGRKWSKAARKAARRWAAWNAGPVQVEIMEVGEDGMLTEELAYNLAITEGEIFGYLYSMGIKPEGVLKLSKDMVKIVCKEYGVEIIDAVPIRVEEMAKKKEIVDGDDLGKLEERPPVLTIMGHVDHGKVRNNVSQFLRF